MNTLSRSKVLKYGRGQRPISELVPWNIPTQVVKEESTAESTTGNGRSSDFQNRCIDTCLHVEMVPCSHEPFQRLLFLANPSRYLVSLLTLSTSTAL